MTIYDIIKLAMKQAGVLGVGQTLLNEDANDALTLVNMMIGQWNIRRWLIYGLQDTFIVSKGATSYTLGQGGDFNQPQTDKLEGAYIVFLNGTGTQKPSFPLRVLMAYQDYALIRLKSLETWPQAVFYDLAFPLGTLHFWPMPQAGLYELHLLTKKVISAFAGLTDTVNLPAQYQEPILYNLGERLRTHYQLPPDPQLSKLAADSLQSLRNSNAQIPTLQMPSGIDNSMTWYNPFSDQGG